MIDLDKFNQITDKVINMLDEEYKLTESHDIENKTKSTVDVLQDQKKIKEKEAKDSLQRKRQAERSNNISKETKDQIIQQHKRDVVERKEAEIKKAKYVSMTQNEEVELDDADLYLLAEEFEYDLNEDINTNAMRATIEAKKVQINNEREDLKKKQEIASNQNKDELKMMQAKMDKIDKQATEAKEKMKEQQLANQQAQESKLQNDVSKLNNEADKVKSMSSIVSSQMTKNESFNAEAINEGLKAGIKAAKVKEEDKKRKKVDVKRGKVIIKMEQIKTKLAKADEANDEDSVKRYSDKLEKITSKYDKLDKKFKKHDKKIVDIGEEYLDESLEDLEKQYDSLYVELNNLDEEFIITENRSALDIECENIISKEDYKDPMLLKLAHQIKDQYNSVPKNELEIKKLLMLFNQYKNR